MAQIWEYIKIALMNIRSNKGRSVLTMLGIVIGIASVIMVMAIGNGVRGQINDELESIGSGMIELYLDTTLETTTMRFMQEDFDMIKERVEHVKGVTPVLGGWGSADGPKGNFEARVTAGTEGLEYYSSGGGPIIKGRYYSAEEADSGSRVCVISESDAISLFGTTDVIGLSFELTLYGISQELTVIGIREDNATSFVSTGVSGRVSIEMPIGVMSNDFYYWTEEFTDILIFAEETQYCTEVAQNAVKLLEGKYGTWGENQIIVNNISDMTGEMDSILGILTMFISFVAAISLLVGGIGVMNIMLVSVTERTREIAGSENRLHPPAVPGGSGNYYDAWRHHRHHTRNAWRQCGMLRPRYYAEDAYIHHHRSDSFFFCGRPVLRNLSGEKSGEAEPD